MEFHKILYMHLYLKALGWDCSLSFFTIFSQICIRAMSLDVCFYSMKKDLQQGYGHTGQCKRTGGCYNELVVAFYSTGGGVKGKKIYTC